MPETTVPTNRSRPPSARASHTKVKRAVPTNVLIPTRGWPAIQYWLNRKLRRRPDLVPALNSAEQQAHDRQVMQANSTAELRQLTDIVPSATVVFIGVKGAAATTATTIYDATVLSELTRSVTVVLDANPASGDSAARLGKDHGQTMSIQDIAQELAAGNNLDQFKDFIKRIRPTRYGVRVITATAIVDGNNRVPVALMEKILHVTQTQCEYLMVDTANDITDPVTLAVVDASTVLVFTANVAVPASLRQLATSMETLRRHGFADKVNNGVVVISNLPAGADLDSYRVFLNRVNLKDEVQELYPFEGPFLGVPHDPEIALDGEVNLEPLAWETLQAYREVNIAWLKQVTTEGTSLQSVSQGESS